MTARAVVLLLAAALLLGGCSQDYNCSYFCGTSKTPKGSVPENGGDPDSVGAQCEKDRASNCTAEEGPTRCECNAANPDLSPGTNSPSSPRASGAEDDPAAGVSLPPPDGVGGGGAGALRFEA